VVTRLCVSIQSGSDLFAGAVYELSNYELVRYPSGQLSFCLRATVNAQAKPTSGPRDVVAAFTSETEARTALMRLADVSEAATPTKLAG